jgi:hypothetical protein
MPSRSGSRRSGAVIEQQVDHGTARLTGDPDRPGAWLLSLDGTPQSYLDPGDPTYLNFEYMRWLGHLVDAVAPAGQPLKVLHLGGGAWTLARYVAAVRPRSRQLVVEHDVALIDLVRRHLPSPGIGIRVRSGDARQVLSGLPAASADLIICDVFQAAQVPAHLTGTGFLTEAVRVLRPGGSYAANLADGPPLRFARGQAATVAAAFAEVALIGSAQVLRGRRFGNLVLLGSAAALPVTQLTRRAAGEPFAARVLDRDGVVSFAGTARPCDDDHATESPPPPAATFG